MLGIQYLKFKWAIALLQKHLAIVPIAILTIGGYHLTDISSNNSTLTAQKCVLQSEVYEAGNSHSIVWK